MRRRARLEQKICGKQSACKTVARFLSFSFHYVPALILSLTTTFITSPPSTQISLSMSLPSFVSRWELKSSQGLWAESLNHPLLTLASVCACTYPPFMHSLRVWRSFKWCVWNWFLEQGWKFQFGLCEREPFGCGDSSGPEPGLQIHAVTC